MRVKQCSCCMLFFTHEAFAADRSTPLGLQSWCRRCKALWERGPENVWKRLHAWLQREEPESLQPPHGWTEELYRERWEAADGKCEACGAGLGEWQHSGHRLDRIDNNTPHIPANCQMLCWVCNRKKSNLPWQTFAKEVALHVAEHGRGRVPWQTMLPWAKRVELPDLGAFEVEVQIALPF